MLKHIFSFFIGAVLTLSLIYLINTLTEKDCYDFHVAECEWAHERNLTYLVCSGFFVNSTQEDFLNSCAVHYLENCSTEIKHGCNWS